MAQVYPRRGSVLIPGVIQSTAVHAGGNNVLSLSPRVIVRNFFSIQKLKPNQTVFTLR